MSNEHVLAISLSGIKRKERERRDALLRKVSRREIGVSDALEAAESDPAIARMRTRDLLSAVKPLGRGRVLPLMAELGIGENAPLRSLTPRQRRELRRLDASPPSLKGLGGGD